MTQELLQELFVEQIRDIYDAEKQLVKALPKLAKATESEDLAEAIRGHLEETRTHVARLEKVFGMIGEPAKGKPCKAMKGLVEEGNEAAQEGDRTLRDLSIIAGAQRVEHYEISAYGTARTIAEQLGLDKAVALLQQTEDEERKADEKLTSVAVSLYEMEDEEEAEPVMARGGKGAGAQSSGRKSAR